MKIFKFFNFVILIICISGLTFSEKRKNPLPMKDLTDISSPSYVPHPYPKTEAEIIADLKYAYENLFLPKEGRKEVLLVKKALCKDMLDNLFKENSIYRIGKILKVKNLIPGYSEDYYWHIIILREDDSITAKILMEANGLFGGMSCGFDKRGTFFMENEDEIIKNLEKALNISIPKKDIKYIQAIELPPDIGTMFNPAFEIKLKNDDVYYYRPWWKDFYKIKKESPMEKIERGNKPSFKNWKRTNKIAIDEINDKIIEFEEVKK